MALKWEDGSLGATCGLLIINKVHLLADERSAVLESVVARLHRWVESSQRQVRLLSAWALCLLVRAPGRGREAFLPNTGISCGKGERKALVSFPTMTPDPH